MAHRCHAEGCTQNVAPRLLMCYRHWCMVPKRLQDAVWANYRQGQEVDKRPSEAYLAAARAAVTAVRNKEQPETLQTRMFPDAD